MIKQPYLAIASWTAILLAADGGLGRAAEPNDATQATQEANAAVLETLPFANQGDWEDARRGFMAKLPEAAITTDDGQPVWDLGKYAFLDDAEKAPSTANPSLWRQERLNNLAGLFRVTDRIYQVRGLDLSNVSFVVGETGYIVIDPLISAETARAAFSLVREQVGDRPIVAVIYSHCHVDHFGGVKGLITDEQVQSGKVQIIAPAGFMDHAVAEYVDAGNVMSRRASYMFGNLLPNGPRGQIGTGLGKTTSTGEVSLIAPTVHIEKTGHEMTVDGVRIVFQVTPGTEAPAEMNFYFPQMKALCMAENTTHTLHNLYTLRGAQVRDARAWARYIHEAIDLFGDEAEVVFAGHHWPCWGQERAVEYMKKQRDLYKYIHDQTLRLANHGHTMDEIAEMIELPESLRTEFYNRGYYGSVNHNVKAVYQRYLGWFDGNPAHLHPLPPTESSRKYVEYMGGAEAVLARARDSYAAGEYRWVAEVVNHVVFAEPENQAARDLQADALEQMGYQAESGPWRNFYLSGAKELRDGIEKVAVPSPASRDMVKALTLDMIFDFMAVRLNGPKAAGRKLTLNFQFTDTGQEYVLMLDRSVLNHTADRQAEDADATIIMTRETLNDVGAKKTTVLEATLRGDIKMTGRLTAFIEFYALLDNFDFWFPIVTP